MIVLCCGKHYTFNGLVIHIEKYGLLKNGQTTFCGSILQFRKQEITYLSRKIYQGIEYIATLLLPKRYDKFSKLLSRYSPIKLRTYFKK